MSLFSMYPSKEGAEEIKRIANRIMTKDHPITGGIRGLTYEQAIIQAGEEVVKKLKKKGLTAARRVKRGLEPEKKKKKKETKKQVEKRVKEEILASLFKSQGTL